MYDLVLKEGMWNEIAYSEGKRRRSFFHCFLVLCVFPYVLENNE